MYEKSLKRTVDSGDSQIGGGKALISEISIVLQSESELPVAKVR